VVIKYIGSIHCYIQQELALLKVHSLDYPCTKIKCIEAKRKQGTGIGQSSREPTIEMKEQKKTMKGKKADHTIQA